MRYEACARQVHANVCALSSLGGVDSSADDIVRVNIFGELFGGAYPGRRSKVAPVQIGVYYTRFAGPQIDPRPPSPTLALTLP